jgi:hypothetical protein
VVGNRIHWIARKIVVTILVGIALFATRNASAAQLTLDWVDNTGGTAFFTIERKTDITGTYARIAWTPTGTTTYVDTAVVAGTTYCYRVQTSNASGNSDYSNEACGSIAIGGMTASGSPTALTVALTAPLEGSIVSQSVTVSGTASSTAARISLMLDGSVVAMVGGTTATYAWNTTTSPNGTHTWTAKAYDASGNSVSSTPASVVVQNSADSAATTDPTVPAKLALAYNGMLRDRVGQGDTALAPDGALDGTLTVTLSAPWGRTVTGLRLDSDGPGAWDTTSGTDFWVLAVAQTLDGAALNAPDTMAVNFPVADGGSFVVFAADYQGLEFLPGRTLTLTATFADGSTATAVTMVPAKLTLAYNGTLRDRVGQGDMALAPDGVLDGTLTVTLNAPGGRTVTGLRLDSDAPGTWDTTSGNGSWVLGVATTLDEALLNAPWTMAVNVPVADGGSFVVFASDYQASEFLPGRTLTLTATFSDGSTAAAVTTVP